jgi:hypothetical protein
MWHKSQSHCKMTSTSSFTCGIMYFFSIFNKTFLTVAKIQKQKLQMEKERLGWGKETLIRGEFRHFVSFLYSILRQVIIKVVQISVTCNYFFHNVCTHMKSYSYYLTNTTIDTHTYIHTYIRRYIHKQYTRAYIHAYVYMYILYICTYVHIYKRSTSNTKKRFYDSE